jgi:hypothetical protein
LLIVKTKAFLKAKEERKELHQDLIDYKAMLNMAKEQKEKQQTADVSGTSRIVKDLTPSPENSAANNNPVAVRKSQTVVLPALNTNR